MQPGQGQRIPFQPFPLVTGLPAPFCSPYGAPARNDAAAAAPPSPRSAPSSPAPPNQCCPSTAQTPLALVGQGQGAHSRELAGRAGILRQYRRSEYGPGMTLGRPVGRCRSSGSITRVWAGRLKPDASHPVIKDPASSAGWPCRFASVKAAQSNLSFPSLPLPLPCPRGSPTDGPAVMRAAQSRYRDPCGARLASTPSGAAVPLSNGAARLIRYLGSSGSQTWLGI
jgi:hypothetical protein